MSNSSIAIRNWSSHFRALHVPIPYIRVREFWLAVRDSLPIYFIDQGAVLVSGFGCRVLIQSNKEVLEKLAETLLVFSDSIDGTPGPRGAGGETRAIVAKTTSLVNTTHEPVLNTWQTLCTGIVIGKENRETATTMLESTQEMVDCCNVVRECDDTAGRHTIYRFFSSNFTFAINVQGDGALLSKISGRDSTHLFSRAANSAALDFAVLLPLRALRRAMAKQTYCALPFLSLLPSTKKRRSDGEMKNNRSSLPYLAEPRPRFCRRR